MSVDHLIELMTPMMKHIESIDLIDAPGSTNNLKLHFPIDSPQILTLRNYIMEHLDSEWLFPKSHRGIRFGRVADKTEHGLSIDIVDMDKAGPSHLHPKGEVDLSFALSGDPKFDAKNEGWTVYPPNSWHRPTVTEGRMVIVYFLPDGALEFCREAPDGAIVYPSNRA